MHTRHQQGRPEVEAVRQSTLFCCCCQEHMMVTANSGPLWIVSLGYKEGIVVGYGLTCELAFHDAHTAKAFRELDDLQGQMP